MDCIFCKIITGQISSEMIYQDDEIVAFPDIKPAAPVHILIVPKKHITSVADVAVDDYHLVGRMIGVANQIAREQGIGENGYRLVFNCGKDGGVGVDHLHLHILGGRKLMSMG